MVIQKRGRRGKDRLSPREKEVYDLVRANHTYVQIGKALGIKPKTVEMHYQHARDKLYAAPFVPLEPGDKPPGSNEP
ncbi:MAG TPA: helix-turn-helix transcriptional regulator [Bryobacteraceae bacterium]|nr:helix-turn-helix transcriptional regulator [Blastocatellia bacterium]HXJ43464.1 helix-turn-helix transcriptional regulator [Bryobacteraceae bacterium]